MLKRILGCALLGRHDGSNHTQRVAIIVQIKRLHLLQAETDLIKMPILQMLNCR